MSITLKLFLLVCVFVHTNSLVCRDEEDNPVDWFIVYKIPILKESGTLIRQGVGFVAMDAQHGKFKFGEYGIDEKYTPVGNTLAPLYGENRTKLSYLLYNDEVPNGPNSTSKGHNKGVIITEEDYGIWLIHSVPAFPPADKYEFPESAKRYGQTFLCITMNNSNINIVGKQLQYNQPNIYAAQVLPNIKEVAPDFADAANNKTVSEAPWFNVGGFHSIEGLPFLSFAKADKWGQELYIDLVAPYLKSSMVVATWPNTPNRIKSDCSKKYSVNNLASIHMNQLVNVTMARFYTIADYSKWAVASTQSHTDWICIGDLDRDQSHENLGGGTVCVDNKKIADNFRTIIGIVEAC